MERAEDNGVGLVAKRAQPAAGALREPPLLTREELAAWLKVRPRQVERLGIPCCDLGRKTKRYRMRDVLTWLERHRRIDERRSA